MSTHQPFDFFIQWHLTESCNLKCTHCYQSGKATEELTLDEIKGVIAEVTAMLGAWEERYGVDFSLSYNVTGGEPFLRKDLFSILGEMAGLKGDIYLLTNGTMLGEKEAERLSALGTKGVQVSVEGPEEVHDTIRGNGSFRRAMQGVSALVRAGIPVTLNVTLSKVNAGHVMGLVDLASAVGARRLGFSRLVPSGRGQGMLNDMLEASRVREVYDSLFSLEGQTVEIVTGDPVASQFRSLDRTDRGSVPIGGCAAGVSGLTILPDGTITPCRRLPVAIGNVKKDSLREVWASSPVLNLLRDRSAYRGKCGSCARWAECRGCRAIAYAYRQSKGEEDFLAEDPQCFIETGARHEDRR